MSWSALLVAVMTMCVNAPIAMADFFATLTDDDENDYNSGYHGDAIIVVINALSIHV